ncbi:M14 family zinc carboxypeptidase [Gammaproteobacteria bacterium]|nr:M14 family zinc carboxypeptidase [Gammaproteobacteria bacterium]
MRLLPRLLPPPKGQLEVLVSKPQLSLILEQKLTVREPRPTDVTLITPRWPRSKLPWQQDPLTTVPKSVAPLSLEKICASLSRVANAQHAELYCLSTQVKDSGRRTAEGLPLYLRDFKPIDDRPPRAKVLVIAATHGDEPSSAVVALSWMTRLKDDANGNASSYHWRFIPFLNPGGMTLNPPTRQNRDGVDLNRNMPSKDWESQAMAAWRKKNNGDPRQFPGPSANSETETRFIVEQIKSFQPDAIISIHAPYGLIDFDARDLSLAPGNMGTLPYRRLGSFPGSLGRYAGIDLGIPTITVELGEAFRAPRMAERRGLWEDLLDWLEKIARHTQ